MRILKLAGCLDVNQSHTLASIGVPCRIVVGEQDYATPVAMATAMQEAITGATLTVIPDVRHFTPLEVPAKIAACYNSFSRFAFYRGGAGQNILSPFIDRHIYHLAIDLGGTGVALPCRFHHRDNLAAQRVISSVLGLKAG